MLLRSIGATAEIVSVMKWRRNRLQRIFIVCAIIHVLLQGRSCDTGKPRKTCVEVEKPVSNMVYSKTFIYRKLSRKRELGENRLSGSHTLLLGVNTFLSVLPTFIVTFGSH